jgi:hypothetical protein
MRTAPPQPTTLCCADLAKWKYAHQILRQMATDGLKMFGKSTGQQNPRPLAHFSEVSELAAKFENDLSIKLQTDLVGHAGPQAL